jgi:hypothetical protein
VEHETVTVTILSLVRAAKESGWDELDLLWLAEQEGVLIDANEDKHVAAFGITPFYVPQAWLEDVKSRPEFQNEEDADE